MGIGGADPHLRAGGEGYRPWLPIAYIAPARVPT
jgi:hypothetical protein